MDPQTIVVEKAAEYAFSKCIELLARFFTSSSLDVNTTRERLRQGLVAQMNKAWNYSKRMELFKMPTVRDPMDFTVELAIRNQHRHFFASGSRNVALSEDTLIRDEQHHLLLGDPGAGKTTTLKRMVGKTLETLFNPSVDAFPFGYAIVVRLGELRETDTFLTYLCKQLGIPFRIIEREIEYEDSVTLDTAQADGEEAPYGVDPQVEFRTGKKKVYEYRIGELDLDVAVGQVLDELEAIVFLDGLDELHYRIRNDAHDEIKKLSSVRPECVSTCNP